jgi:hypothetical protein
MHKIGVLLILFSNIHTMEESSTQNLCSLLIQFFQRNPHAGKKKEILIETVKKLIDTGTSVNHPYAGKFPLHYAMHYKVPIQLVHYLMQAGAVVNVKDNNECTPLHWAAFLNNYEAVKILLAAGADKNAQDKEGKTPVYHAIIGGSLRIIVRLLLHCGTSSKVKQESINESREVLSSMVTFLDDDDQDEVREIPDFVVFSLLAMIARPSKL